MGQWAQRRRSGSLGSPAAAVASVTIVSVTVVDAVTAAITFSGVITIDTGVTPDDGFDYNGGAPDSVTRPSSHVVYAVMTAGVNSGDPWTLSAQPNWLITPVVVPESGTVP
jgi:hypothetical protein